MQFLQSAWLLSESGTVANRLGQVLEKQGQREKARHIYALAVAAGGSDVADSRARLAKIAGDSVAAKEIAAAAAELVETRTLKLGTITGKSVSAPSNPSFRYTRKVLTRWPFAAISAACLALRSATSRSCSARN